MILTTFILSLVAGCTVADFEQLGAPAGIQIGEGVGYSCVESRVEVLPDEVVKELGFSAEAMLAAVSDDVVAPR